MREKSTKKEIKFLTKDGMSQIDFLLSETDWDDVLIQSNTESINSLTEKNYHILNSVMINAPLLNPPSLLATINPGFLRMFKKLVETLNVPWTRRL